MKPHFFLQEGFPSHCMYLELDRSIWAKTGKYMFVIFPPWRILENRKEKSDNVAP